MQKARHLRRAQVREETPHAYGGANTTMIRAREVCSISHRATRFSNEDFAFQWFMLTGLPCGWSAGQKINFSSARN